MKNYLLLALFALGASAQVAAYYDQNGNHYTYDANGNRIYRGGVVRDAAHGAHEIGHDAHVAASNIFHDIVG